MTEPSPLHALLEKLKAIRSELRLLGEDAQRWPPTTPNLAERIWDECDKLAELEATLTAAPQTSEKEIGPLETIIRPSDLRPVNGRLHALLERLDEWAITEDVPRSDSEELLLDIQQCLESLLRDYTWEAQAGPSHPEMTMAAWEPARIPPMSMRQEHWHGLDRWIFRDDEGTDWLVIYTGYRDSPLQFQKLNVMSATERAEWLREARPLPSERPEKEPK